MSGLGWTSIETCELCAGAFDSHTWLLLEQQLLVGLGVFCVVVAGTLQVTGPGLVQCLRLWMDTWEREKGRKVCFCDDIRPIIFVLLSASLVLAVQSFKEKTGYVFLPKLSHLLVFFYSEMQNSLKWPSLMPDNPELARSSDLSPDIWKNEICLGRR